MRYPDTHKETVRAKIVEVAARALRSDGLAGVSIPAIMKKAGLTHGGFYNHFEDRDELVAEAVRHAADDTALADETRDLEGVVETYLSTGHLEHPELGCVLGALGTEAVRQEGATRRSFAETARGFLGRIDGKRGGAKRKAPSDESLVVASQMIGALILARLVDDPALADRILSASRRAIARSPR